MKILNKKMKTFLFIDGTNLYSAQFELFGAKMYLDFPSFIKEIENKIMYKTIIFFETIILKITNKKLNFNKRFKEPTVISLNYKNLLQEVDLKNNP